MTGLTSHAPNHRRRLTPGAFLLSQFHERKSLSTFAGIALCAALVEPLAARPIAANARKGAV